MKFYRIFPTFAFVFAAVPVLASGVEQIDQNPSQIQVMSKKKQISKNIWMPNRLTQEFPSPEWVSLGRMYMPDCKSVSLSKDGRTVARGCPYYNNSQGRVFVHSLINNVWVEQEVFDGEASNDLSGWPVVLSGDGSTVAICATDNDGNGSTSGHVRVYRNLNGSWTQLGQDLDGEASSDYSGRSASLSQDGSTLAIGASHNDGNGSESGHVRVYQYSNNTWTQVGDDIDGEAAGNRSGWAVSLSGDGSILAIGAYRNGDNGSDSGHVRVYQYSNNAWTQLGMDLNGEASGDESGKSLSVSEDGSTVAISAYRNDGNGSDSGHVRVYRYSNNAWTQLGMDLDGEGSGDESRSVSLSEDGSILAIGAKNNDGNGSDSGHVRVYRYSNSNNAWTQEGVDLDGTSANMKLGMVVSLSGDGKTLAAADISYTNIYSLLPTWWIADATFADHLNQQTSYITLTHDIGTANSDLELTLYKYDCETIVESDAALSFDNEGISDRKASYDVMLARGSVGSSVLLEGDDELQFCVGAGLHVPEVDMPEGVDDYGSSIVSKKTKIAIAFNLENAQFTVTAFETQGENPGDTIIEADDNFYEMEACICSESFDCDSLTGVVAAQQENSVVFICLKPPTGLNFEDYNMIFSKGDVEPAQSDFSYDAIGSPFTSEEKEGNMIRVRTQLLSGLFDVGQDGVARVSGTGNFVFDTNAKDGKEDEVEGNYKMFVGLQEVEECEQGLLRLLKNALRL